MQLSRVNRSVADRLHSASLIHKYNSTPHHPATHLIQLEELLALVGPRTVVRPPFYVDYGYNITLGADVFLNFNCVLLDVTPITIGDRTQIGPFTQIYAADHPRDHETRRAHLENGRPVHIGGKHMVFSGVYGPPFVREGEVRRDAKMADFENFVKLSQAFPELDSPGGTIVEPEDRPLDSRHLDMVYALQTLSDKPYQGSVISAENARDTIAMARSRSAARCPTPRSASR